MSIAIQVESLKLDQLDSVQSLEQLRIPPPAIDWRYFREIVKTNTAYESTNSTESALFGERVITPVPGQSFRQ